MLARARLSNLSFPAQKVRLVVDQIRGRGVNDALAVLHGHRRAAARDLEKLLRSAVANASSGERRVDPDVLFVARATVDGGASLKRGRNTTMGRIFRVLKRTCHVTLELDTRDGEAPAAPRRRG